MADTRGDDESVHPAFMRGGGEAGALVRAFDWSRTPLGPPHGWPASLKTTVGMLLRSRHPMFLMWGPELVQFYNDAYLPSFGVGKHPRAMGQCAADCWQEIWPVIWPQIDDVMRHGLASWNEDQLVPIFRNGRIEEVYWTYGYSPILDDDGRVGGTLVVCTETTSRVLGARRMQSMRELAEATSAASEAGAILDAAGDLLARNPHDVPFALIYATSESGELSPCRTVALDDSAAAVLDAEIRDCIFETRMSAVPQQIGVTAAIAVDPWPERVEQVYLVPFAGGGHRRETAWLAVGLSPRLPFDEAYRAYLRQFGEQIAHGLAHLRGLRARALVESERNNLLEQAPVAAAIMTGPDHVFQLANRRYLQMIGRNDILGRPYLAVFPEMAASPLPRILDGVYASGEPYVANELAVPLDRRGDGAVEAIYFNFTLEPLRTGSGEVYGMMAVSIDVTPQVLARKGLERTQAERERLLRELESASRAKDEFLAMLGHELRNPLSPILTALQLMHLRGVRGGERERAIIERQIKHVVGLVDDLLDVSRITRGRVEIKRARVRLADVVAKGIEQASPLIEQRRHRLAVEVPPDLYLYADAARLAQVVANLLTNAAKYTDPDGEIDVRAAGDGQALTFHVRDNGTGISPEMLAHVFDAFAQERRREAHAHGGLGLGLAIVKSLVEAHGGTVAIHSEGRGCGVECVVRLPLAAALRADSAAGDAQPPAAPEAEGCRVLLVDDNQDAALLLGDSLAALGHRVETAFDAPSALALAARFVPDVALLDLGMPIIDGYELAARLRTCEGWAAIPFAALTGYGQQHDKERSHAAGFRAHLVKPIDLEEVDATIRRLSDDGWSAQGERPKAKG